MSTMYKTTQGASRAFRNGSETVLQGILPLLVFVFASLSLAAQFPTGGAQDREQYQRPCPDQLQLQVDVIHASAAGESDGAIDLSVSGGEPPYKFVWTSPAFHAASEDIANLPAGEYMVLVCDALDCDATAFVNVKDRTVISEVGEEPAGIINAVHGLKVLPNPAADHIVIDYSLSKSSDITLTINDQLGNTIAVAFDGRAGVGSHSLEFDVSRLAPGAYFCRISTAAGQTACKFAVTR